jgi:hypothetical protein
VQVESRDQIIKRIGRSPDFASAVILALMERPDLTRWEDELDRKKREPFSYDPIELASREWR